LPPKSFPRMQLPAREPIWDTVQVPHRLELGLRALEPAESWLELDADLESDLRTKRDLLRDRRGQVFVELPESRAAQHEVLVAVTETLLEKFPLHYSRTSNRLCVEATGDEIDLDDSSRPPLELASICVQEDLVVMQQRGGEWCLTAGSVCFPTRWDLAPLLGQPMHRIHGRVPGYRQELDAVSNRFFDTMTEGTVFRRGNWSMMDDPSLFQPASRRQNRARRDLNESNAGTEVWLRVEHQTLQRLPMSGAILFTIRVHRTRLDAVAGDAEAARSLIGAMESMHPAMRRYKALDRVRGVSTAYLRRKIDGA